ncbi:MFS transporter [Nocardia stercoris]|uniref:MFS transporter n=1 Tax=Nocardia stercoris TaxID=2483361 RepID=A0A3M2L3W9_9NOCA|nr:MFS transporter [Nocardia stercoris]RMI32347.1 MFS transporter [Nocardia stercoris]
MSTYGGHPLSPLRSWLGVAVITASLFTFVTTELMPVGLLTPLSSALHVATGTAGLIVTLFGISAGLGVPFLVAWTRRVNRRALLPILLTVMAVGNLVVAVAPNFGLVLVTRLIMGFAHGMFWAVAVSMAMRLVPGPHANRAAAIALSGISIGTVVGIPLGTFIGGLAGWRTTFLIWSALAVVVLALVLVTIPSLPSENAVAAREVFALPVRNAALRIVMVTVILYVLGHFGAYTFIRPFLEKTDAASSAFITVLLVVYGIGGAAGNFIAGHAVDKNPRASFGIACGGLVVSLLLLLGAGHSPAGALVAMTLWGVSFGAANLCQINLTLAAAPDTFEAAMSINTLGYNLSIALGALIGGLFADHLGVRSTLWFAVALTAASVVLAVIMIRAPRETGDHDRSSSRADVAVEA